MNRHVDLNTPLAEALEQRGFGTVAWEAAETCAFGHDRHPAQGIGAICRTCEAQYAREHGYLPFSQECEDAIRADPDGYQYCFDRVARDFSQMTNLWQALTAVMASYTRWEVHLERIGEQLYDATVECEQACGTAAMGIDPASALAAALLRFLSREV
ncbi:hypothetical protein [Sulfobacillus harzensis]|uniref:Uncharacterized protein n=1 Tax=Sulfobacillus harzensis TaxID=2729629 RepID=A0A7Y0Q204_9FIRM|nr:hypothetical protein [Sulfobacillus harzensis]NMP21875.1 hypothetical protein [Sulfobacillus harzensis]